MKKTGFGTDPRGKKYDPETTHEEIDRIRKRPSRRKKQDPQPILAKKKQDPELTLEGKTGSGNVPREKEQDPQPILARKKNRIQN